MHQNNRITQIEGARRGLRDITNVSGANGHPQTKVSSNQLVGKSKSSDVPSLPPTSSLGDSSEATSYNRREADDIDARDANNPLMVTNYVQDIYAHMRQKEIASISTTYMQRQPHINEKMRAILIDWLIEVHQKFRCVPETLYLTTNLIDRYLELEQVERSKLQLVGVTALLLAAKYEEIYPPELRDLVYITDKAYTKEEILAMETKILNALQFKVTIASTHSFLVRYLKAAHADRRMVWLACFITERFLQEYSMLQYLPSIVASCAVYLARKNLQRNPWSPTLLKYTSYSESTLRPCLQEMTGILGLKTSLTAVSKKYSSQKFGGVASMSIGGI
mmetsp:Transcript_30891/g.69398  ORF Transcript_30891/g.69398 Transcript_30891/m.69398 type:complete len:335 (-) Transcript_30891:369-1373(-)|eukprot:CAMPEP_0172615108 /NCGR_PEP_ID=MMETSP1068-20121228/55848_1 /TAXON_ID=35684 /ORGANISM="Pseudopedinella elastica, Strain CCMP716" /LENGTH=334 /DNA_ID=CAMNT_0013420139 /DNA_START=59 /DNA_END=1063 /DNA_ORIENTATION=+